MKLAHLYHFSVFGLKTILFKRKKAILGTIIVTDKCNLHCKHCSVNNITGVIYPYQQIQQEMLALYKQGVRILFFCGGETFLWQDSGKTLRDLVTEAKALGFYIVNVVTNGTFPLDLPEADIILVSLDGGKEQHNAIRGETYDDIMRNIAKATANNIVLYTALNQHNKHSIQAVCETAKKKKTVNAVSFNFHTPYPGTEALALSVADKAQCCNTMSSLMEAGYPVLNLRSAFPYIIHNTFPVPCHQCVVVENGTQAVCGRCVAIPGLCEQCGYFFAAEYTLIFSGRIRVIVDMLKTYLRYI